MNVDIDLNEDKDKNDYDGDDAGVFIWHIQNKRSPTARAKNNKLANWPISVGNLHFQGKICK